MSFDATKAHVANRGVPPDSFLTQLVEWGRSAPEEIFAPNESPRDIYATVKGILGPWQPSPHRRAVMLEVMRVHAGFESSWNWNEGVDTTNHNSVAHIEGQETGAWQVSFDSTGLGNNAMLNNFAKERGIGTPQQFIGLMKRDHNLAMEYYARLIRVSVAWAGPIKRHEIDPWLQWDAVKEFQTLLT